MPMPILCTTLRAARAFVSESSESIQPGRIKVDSGHGWNRPSSMPSVLQLAVLPRPANHKASPWGSGPPTGILDRGLPLVPASQRLLDAHVPKPRHICAVYAQPALPTRRNSHMGRHGGRNIPPGVQSASDDYRAPPFPGTALMRPVEHVLLHRGDTVQDASSAATCRPQDVDMIEVCRLNGKRGLGICSRTFSDWRCREQPQGIKTAVEVDNRHGLVVRCDNQGRHQDVEQLLVAARDRQRRRSRIAPDQVMQRANWEFPKPGRGSGRNTSIAIVCVVGGGCNEAGAERSEDLKRGAGLIIL